MSMEISVTKNARVQPVALVVDDDAGLRKFGEMMVEAAGFRPETAASGVEALAMMQRLDPAVVLLDLQMPGKDGIDVMHGMAAAKCTAKLVIFSGNDRRTLEVSAEIARQRGLTVVASFKKPVAADKLRQVLNGLSLELCPFDEARLRECLEQDMLRLHYQPKIDLVTREICGVEALLRCQDASGRSISPESILAIAEQCGAVDEISQAIFAAAIQQRADWSKAGLDLGMAVNLSARGAMNPDLPDRLFDLCVKAQVPPEAITVELTETAVMNDSLLAMETLVRLRLRGFELSIDDFGTGYSSLVRLQQLPFSELKIDKSFVTTRQKSPENSVIIRTLAQLAQNLDLKCVVEGVEDEATLDFVASLGCNSAQGYFMSPALPPDGVPRFVKEWHTRQKWQRHRNRAQKAEAETPPQQASQAAAE
jgi:EAL domain-containing protein (putative c-di-GMP-specific phosphodiesterase class I)/ActR/RegA family two-component response regulator